VPVPADIHAAARGVDEAGSHQTRKNEMNSPSLRLRARFAAGLGLLLAAPLTSAEGTSDRIRATLVGFKEVPAISSPASGFFGAHIDDKAGTITYVLSYSGLTGDVQQAHIHVGQRSVNGAISVFLCQTGASADPTGLAPECPQSGTVKGVLQSANMVEGDIEGQGIAPGEFAELVAAIRAGVAYVNVHSATFPAGEVRGQLRQPERR
jgi:CHRD domain